jgi:hypothetical protein
MPFQPVPGVAQLCWRWTIFDVPLQCCIYLTRAETITEGALTTLTSAAMADYIANVAPDMSEDVILNEIYARSLVTETAPQSTNTNAGTPVPGGTAIVAENGSQAFILAFESGLTGRSSRGRIFWPIPVASATLDGVFDTLTVAALTTLLVDHIEACEVLDFEHVIVSRYSGGVQRAEGVTFDITSYAGRSLIGSQRDRRVGAS